MFALHSSFRFLQFDRARRKAELNDKLSSLKFMLSEASLQLLPEYGHRVEVRDTYPDYTCGTM